MGYYPSHIFLTQKMQNMMYFQFQKYNDTLQDGANINHLIGLWGNSFNKTVPLN